MGEDTIVRLLLLEDEHELARLVACSLERSGFLVDLARTIAFALSAVLTNRYDLLILDRGLPDGDSLQLLRTVRGRGMLMPVIFLTAQSRVDAKVAGFETGADDYLVKPVEVLELIARIRALLRRPPISAKPTLVAGNVEFDPVTRSLRIGGHGIAVARRECMLLREFLRRAGHVLSREALEAALYGLDDEASPNAIEASVSRLRKTLTGAGADHRIHTVRGIGYCLAP